MRGERSYTKVHLSLGTVKSRNDFEVVGLITDCVYVPYEQFIVFPSGRCVSVEESGVPRRTTGGGRRERRLCRGRTVRKMYFRGIGRVGSSRREKGRESLPVIRNDGYGRHNVKKI